MLFIDALQRMVRIAQEGAMAKAKAEVNDVRTETNFAARRFYAQRNCESGTRSRAAARISGGNVGSLSCSTQQKLLNYHPQPPSY